MIVYRFASCQTGDVDILALQLTRKDLIQVNVNDDFLQSVSPLANCWDFLFLVSSFSVGKIANRAGLPQQQCSGFMNHQNSVMKSFMKSAPISWPNFLKVI